MAGNPGAPVGNKTQFMGQRNLTNIPAGTVIRPESVGLLMNTYSLQQVAAKIATITGKALPADDIPLLQNFINKYRLDRFAGGPINTAWTELAYDFIQAKRNIAEYRSTLDPLVIPPFNARANPLDQEMGGAYRDLQGGYLTREVKTLSNNENPMRTTLHPQLDASALDTPRSQPVGETVTQADLFRKISTALDNIRGVISPETLDDALKRIQFSNTNYASVNLRTITVDFDSRNRITNANQYQWMLNGAAQAGQRGNVIVNDLPQNLLFMRIFDMTLPYTANFGSYYGNIRLYIPELRGMAVPVNQYLGQDNERNIVNNYHFEFTMEGIVGDRVLIKPVNATYIFRRPLLQLSTITFEWYNPFDLVQLAPDSGVFTANYGTPTLVFTGGNTSSLSTGSLVYISGAVTTPTRIAREVNRDQGWICTVLSATSFSIPLDTTILAPSVQTGLYVYFGNQRIFAKLELKCLDLQ